MGVLESPAGQLDGVNEKLEAMEAAVSRQRVRFAAVLEIGSALSSARDIDALLELVVDRVSALLGAEAATLFMLDDRQQELWSRVLKGSTLKEIRVPADSGIVGHVLRTGETISVGDAYADPRFNPGVDRQSGFKTRSTIAAPLRHVSGRVLGVLQVLHRKADVFGQEDAHLVEAVAAQIAGVLDNVLLLEQLRRQNEALKGAQAELSEAVRELDVLFEVEKAVNTTADQTEVLGTILDKALRVSGAHAAAILLTEEEEGRLFFRSARGEKGEKSEALTSLQISSHRGIAGHVVRSGEVVRTDAAEAHPHHDRSLAKKLGVQIKELLCVPIPGERGCLGALELVNKAGGFTLADERLVTVLAGQTGRVILQRRAQAEGEREARLSSIGQMLSGVLHDLRTPISIVSGYVQLLQIEESEDERAKYAEIIDRQFDHIHAMTRETLAFARGERDLLIRRVHMNKFLPEIEAFLRTDFDDTGVELKFNTSYDGAARFDENKMKRLIYNIARNAAQAMENQEGARFTVTVDKIDEHLVMRFSDNGPGIPLAIADRLFDAFVSAGRKTGTGLGLAIVKKIAEEHAGTVTFRSKPGKGTTFEVKIPA